MRKLFVMWLASVAMLLLGAVFLSSCARPEVPSPVPAPSTAPSASPTPQATVPASCPPLTRWAAYVHHYMDHRFQLTDRAVVGGYVMIDSTPLFDGRPCNAERHEVCQLPGAPDGVYRRCEDPRGATWYLMGPAAVDVVQLPGPDAGYQMRVQVLGPGTVTARACPPRDLHDGEDPPRPVDVAGDGCGAVSFSAE